MTKNSKYFIAFGGLALVCLLLSLGFRGIETKAEGEEASEFSKNGQRKISSEDNKLTKEDVSKFLAEFRRNILSKDPKVRNETISMLVEERRRNISFLIGDILRDDGIYRENPDSVVDAMRLLGKLRSKEAVVFLVERLDFQAPGANTPTRPYHILNGREAVFALIEIGKPAIPAVVREVLRKEDHVKLMCAGAVIHKIEGKDLGSFYLQKLFEKEADPAKKATLQKLIQIVEKDPWKTL